MSSADPKAILEAPYTKFATSLLPLYAGPHVRIRIEVTGTEYRLSKALLCKQSPYFAATFEGKFQEGEEQSTTLTEIDGVVSNRSFELLVQWLYLGRIIFDESIPEEAITSTIEFVRFADMCGVIGMERLMADRIKAIIIANNDPLLLKTRDPDSNTRCLISQHIDSAVLLPEGHPVRDVLAAAAVEGYLQHDNCKFLEEILKVPGFSIDFLKSLKATLKSLSVEEMVKNCITFKEPISGKAISLKMPQD